jgi:hypothetical protein
VRTSNRFYFVFTTAMDRQNVSVRID